MRGNTVNIFSGFVSLELSRLGMLHKWLVSCIHLPDHIGHRYEVIWLFFKHLAFFNKCVKFAFLLAVSLLRMAVSKHGWWQMGASLS